MNKYIKYFIASIIAILPLAFFLKRDKELPIIVSMSGPYEVDLNKINPKLESKKNTLRSYLNMAHYETEVNKNEREARKWRDLYKKYSKLYEKINNIKIEMISDEEYMKIIETKICEIK